MLFILFSVTSGVHYLILQYKDSHAKELYQEGEMKLEDEKYKAARDLFKRALNQKKDFYNAKVSMTFTNNVLQIQREFRSEERRVGKECRSRSRRDEREGNGRVDRRGGA